MIAKLAAFLALVAADQTLKLWALQKLSQMEYVPLLPGVVRMIYVENRGAAFGMMQDMRWILIPVTIGALAAIAWELKKKILRCPPLGNWALLLIAAGAAGNLIDRVFRGFVVDMFAFEFINFAIFNLADACISVGAVVFCACILFARDHRANGKETV